jgi:hypothetical protein
MAAMNNFPAMTEERRQELIKHCKYNILHANGILPTLEGVDPNSEVARKVRKELELQEIALSALTTEPVELPAVFDAFNLKTDWQRGFLDGQNDYRGELEEFGPLYTAPPAPVLRVPDELKVKEDSHQSHIDYAEGWADCIDEVKRMNGSN